MKKEKGEREYFIKEPNREIEHPAWRHEDGTIVSYWDNLPQLLIKDEMGIRFIDHDIAVELGYEKP